MKISRISSVNCCSTHRGQQSVLRL